MESISVRRASIPDAFDVFRLVEEYYDVVSVVVRDMRRAGEVKRLYVQPPFRRRGLAQMLLDDLERFALDRGDEWLHLDTNDACKRRSCSINGTATFRARGTTTIRRLRFSCASG